MKTTSVIVCYNPVDSDLRHLCLKLVQNGSSLVLVDNTEKSYLTGFEEFADCVLIRLGANTGIAHAQNIGISRAVQNGAEVVVFFDQDSKIGDNFLSILLAPLKAGEPGIVAPVLFDEIENFEFPTMKLGKYGWLIKVYKWGRQIPYTADVVTSSGTAATTVVFDVAGLMDEDFFIDYVDTEWSLRCRSKNIPIQVVPTAIMQHSVGNKSINFGFMRGFVHSPERSYYVIRNCFLLFRKRSVPVLAAFMEIVSVFIHYAMAFIFLRNKSIYAGNYCLAIMHGVKGVVGKKPV